MVKRRRRPRLRHAVAVVVGGYIVVILSFARRRDTKQPQNATCEAILAGSDGGPAMRYWRDGEVFASGYGRGGYVTFEPDAGGFNNVRMAFEAVAVFAHATGRVLVMPPRQRLYLLKQAHDGNKEAFHGIDAFVDVDNLGESLRVIDTVEHTRRVAPDMVELAMRAAKSGAPVHRRRLREWQRQTAHMVPRWDPMREILAFGECRRPHIPWRSSTASTLAGKRRIRHVDQRLLDAEWIHFATNTSSGYRMFTHWYTFMLFDYGPLDAYYKRFARDRLRYRTEIVCVAGRIVRLIDAYSAIHVRRGELQYVSVRVSCAQLNHTLSGWLRPGERVLVLTDEKDREWFRPLRDVYSLVFVDELMRRIPHELDPNSMGMVEQLVAAQARTFTGTFFSTFSSYVARLRAYYHKRPDTFFYAAPPDKRFVMHSSDLHVGYPYYNREWPLGWTPLREGDVPSSSTSSFEVPATLDYADLHVQAAVYPKQAVERARLREAIAAGSPA